MIPTRLPHALLSLRLGVLVVMFIWTLDKFVRPEHTAAVFKNFYLIGGIGSAASYIIGTLQAIIVAAFALGFKKRFSYGLILLLHGVSTFSSFRQYLNPWEGANILFFAAWPMLAAIVALYILREQDTLLSIDFRMKEQEIQSND